MRGYRFVRALAISVVALGGVGTAPAAADDTFANLDCTFVPGSVMGTSGMPSLAQDAADNNSFEPSGLFDTEMGTFTFSGPLTCEGHDRAGNTGSSSDDFAGVYQLTGSGTWVNFTCMTFTMNGSATLTGPATSVGMDFGITFEHGKGVWSNVINSGSIQGVLGTSNTVRGGNGTGTNRVTPSAGSCGTGPGVTSWLLDGKFHTSLSG